MPKRKSKKQTKNRTKKTELKQKTEHIKPEVKVNNEEITALDIVNRSDNDMKEKGSVLAYAKKNPEYAAFIFTIVTTIAFFLIKMLAFLFFAGQCIYYNVELNYIKVDSDPIIFTTLIILLFIILVAVIENKFDEMNNAHPVVFKILAFIFLSVSIFFTIVNNVSSIKLHLRIIISCILSMIVLLLYCGSIFIVNKLLHKMGVDLKSDVNSYSQVKEELYSQVKEELLRKKVNLIRARYVLGIILLLLIFIFSFYFGNSNAREQKIYKTIEDRYIVLYMNDDIAICSPYTEKTNCITIYLKIHRNFSLSDIEFETKEFEEVIFENER